MFDFGFGELLLFAVIALVVLGPEKLPHATRMAGAWLGRLKRALADIQADIEKEVSLQELRDRLQRDLAVAQTAEAQQMLRAQIDALNQTLKASAGKPPLDSTRDA